MAEAPTGLRPTRSPAHAYRNEIDKAFAWLEQAYAQRDPGVTFTGTDVLLRPLHGDPRWQPFLRKLNLA